MQKFEYFGGEQRSPEWFKLRIGKITASRLGDWLAVSKAEKTLGKPLKARLDYETELMFERQFKVAYNNYTNDAMEDGINYEAFAVTQYEKIKKVTSEVCGAWFNDTFMASPDRTVGKDGLVEVKVVRDNTFTSILIDGVPDKHWKQIQGQLLASGRKWCDYVVLNLNTKKIKIIRVFANEEAHGYSKGEFFPYLEESIKEKLVVAKFSEDQLFDLFDKPEIIEPAMLSNNNPNFTDF